MPCKRRGAAGDVYLCPGSTPGAHLSMLTSWPGVSCSLQPRACAVGRPVHRCHGIKPNEAHSALLGTRGRSR